MIENIDDFVSIALIIGLIVYILYRLVRAASFRGMERRLKEEQKYYKRWTADEELLEEDRKSKGEQI